MLVASLVAITAVVAVAVAATTCGRSGGRGVARCLEETVSQERSVRVQPAFVFVTGVVGGMHAVAITAAAVAIAAAAA